MGSLAARRGSRHCDIVYTGVYVGSVPLAGNNTRAIPLLRSPNGREPVCLTDSNVTPTLNNCQAIELTEPGEKTDPIDCP